MLSVAEICKWLANTSSSSWPSSYQMNSEGSWIAWIASMLKECFALFPNVHEYLSYTTSLTQKCFVSVMTLDGGYDDIKALNTVAAGTHAFGDCHGLWSFSWNSIENLYSLQNCKQKALTTYLFNQDMTGTPREFWVQNSCKKGALWLGPAAGPTVSSHLTQQNQVRFLWSVLYNSPGRRYWCFTVQTTCHERTISKRHESALNIF